MSETLDARLWYLDDAASTALLGAPDEWFHEVRWEPRTLGAPGARAAAAGPWIVLGDGGGLAAAIAARRAGVRTVLAAPGATFSLEGDRATFRAAEPADVKRLVEAVPGAAAVLHLGAVAPAGDPAQGGTEGLLHVLRGLLSTSGGARPRLWIVTRGTQPAAPGDRCDDPFGAALWGMGRSASAEHAECWGGLVDLAPGEAPEAVAAALVREVEAGTAEDKVALRGSQRLVPRLARRPRAASGAEVRLRADGTYAVTGGLGGIGLAMAGWLVERGARELLLLGRTALPPREAWAGLPPGSADARRVEGVRALERAGARVETAAVDVAVEGPLERCLEARRARGAPPVRGVVHAAGVLAFQPLDALEVAPLRALLAAKVEGAWRLHRVLAREPLDLFVLCSSSSALLPSPLLGGYAAGNAFLDALAHHRRARGQAALSVNWGTWGEVGMAVEAAKGAAAMPTGFGTISTARGLAALGELVDGGAVQAAVMPVDWPVLARTYPAFAADPFLQDVLGDVRAQATAGGGLSRAALRAADAGERGTLLALHLRAEVARVLGMKPEAVDAAVPLSSLGFDSLMAVQLKNQLEGELGVVVPMIQLLQGPSLDQLTPAVLAAFDAGPAAAEAESGKMEEWEEGSL